MTTTFPYSTASELEHELESTADTVRECVIYGDVYAEPIEIVIGFINANWQRLEDWIEGNNEPT